MVFREKTCPKCKGDVWLDQDEYGWYEQCTMCDYLCSLEGIRYMNGVESLVVFRQDNPKVYSFRSLIETLGTMMKSGVREARVYILTELSKGAMEKRHLSSIMIKEGIFRYSFETALKELRDAGMVVTNKAVYKGGRRKLALVNQV